MKLLVYILLTSIILSCNDYEEYPCLKDGWSNEKVVEGEISQYSPMDEGGHGSRETFMVDSISFSYSDYNSTGEGFYHNSCVKGGVICENGQKVRITYKTLCEYKVGIVNLELLD